MERALSRPRWVYSPKGWHQAPRLVPVERAIAISYNGSTQAVMMASPSDLEDFARGFTLTEAIAAPEEIETIEIRELAEGIELGIWLRDNAAQRLAERRRSMAGPVGCGLCGIDSLAEALRKPAKVLADLAMAPAEVIEAAETLRAYQPLQDQTRAVHAAAFYRPGQGMQLSREDVGRHNALDKLAGALLAEGVAAGEGAVVLTSRVSIDMVQKVARIGAPILIAVSAPTSAALDLADELGLTVVALVRGTGFEVFTHAARITQSALKEEELRLGA